MVFIFCQSTVGFGTFPPRRQHHRNPPNGLHSALLMMTSPHTCPLCMPSPFRFSEIRDDRN
uniref:Uncharacterized protein n=1 Tax=Anguilla anguilla TaxID=7936 RepID=A0A0E9SKN0_ANGAN